MTILPLTSSGGSLIYSGRKVGLRLEPLRAPSWTGYLTDDFPSRANWSCLILRKKRNNAKYLTKSSIRLKFMKKTSKPNPVKGLRYINCYSSNSPNLLKALKILSDTAVRTSAVDWEDLKPYMKSDERSHFLRWSARLFLQVFQTLY